jgi:hypothetical protein
MKQLTPSNYTQDKYFGPVSRAVGVVLEKKGFVSPVEVLLQLQRISKQQYEDWRFGRIPYLERVTIGGLGTMSRILRILDLHCRTQGLVPSQTAYCQWGKRGKGLPLRFSKSGNSNIEAAYSCHFIPEGNERRQQEVSKLTVTLVKPVAGSRVRVESLQDFTMDRDRKNIPF